MFIQIANYAAGPYRLFHPVGDIVEVSDEVAKKMIESGHGLASTKEAFEAAKGVKKKAGENTQQ